MKNKSSVLMDIIDILKERDKKLKEVMQEGIRAGKERAELKMNGDSDYVREMEKVYIGGLETMQEVVIQTLDSDLEAIIKSFDVNTVVN
jgi:hypothetical protein